MSQRRVSAHALTRPALATATVLLTLAATACGSDVATSEDKSPQQIRTAEQIPTQTHTATPDDVAAKTPASSTPTPDTSRVVAPYMDALMSGNPKQMQKAAEKYAKPKSVAYAYMNEQAHVNAAELDAGMGTAAGQSYTRTGDTFKSCGYDNSGGEVCTKFAGFKTSGGKLTDLTIDGKSPGPVLAVGSGDVVADHGVKFEFLSAYVARSGGALWVNAKVTSGDQPFTVFASSATYRSPDGAQRQVAQAYEPSDLAPNSTATVAMIFPGVEPGGTVVITGTIGDNFSDEVEAKLKVG